MDRLAVLSDVHGNLTAFEAVLADIESRGIGTVYNLGDVIGKGPRGSAAIALSRARCALTVRGNWDDFIDDPQDDWSEGLRWWHDELTVSERTWLATLPLSHDLHISGRRVRMFHASATSVHTRVHFRHDDEVFAGMFAATELTGPGPEPDVVLYGDIHSAYVKTRHQRTLANTGSVGNPLDEPTAAYLILEGYLDAEDAAPFSVQIVRVPYDIEAELAVAREVAMPERGAWEVELRTGIYRGRQGSTD